MTLRVFASTAAIAVFACCSTHVWSFEPDHNTARTVAGTGAPGYSGDGGPASKAQLNEPFGVCFNSAGEMLIADCSNHCIRKVDKQGVISTLAGSGKKGYSGDGGPAVKATMNEPYAVEVDSDGDIFIADRLNACVRFVNPQGKIFTLAGTGVKGYNGDGQLATKAQFVEPNGLALDGKHILYIADVGDNRIRRVDLRNGIISTICGTGKEEETGDGDLASAASIKGARAVAVGPEGNIYICERSGNRIREIDHRTSIIRTISGTGKVGYTGDGKASILATFNGPKWVEAGDRGTLYVVDTENHCVRRIDPDTGIVTTVLGCGLKGYAGDGDIGSKAKLNRPHGCCIHDGVLYVADTENHCIRAVPLK
jgi:sugar lactone lactonase YvrE